MKPGDLARLTQAIRTYDFGRFHEYPVGTPCVVLEWVEGPATDPPSPDFVSILISGRVAATSRNSVEILDEGG